MYHEWTDFPRVQVAFWAPWQLLVAHEMPASLCCQCFIFMAFNKSGHRQKNKQVKGTGLGTRHAAGNENHSVSGHILSTEAADGSTHPKPWPECLSTNPHWTGPSTFTNQHLSSSSVLEVPASQSYCFLYPPGLRYKIQKIKRTAYEKPTETRGSKWCGLRSRSQFDVTSVAFLQCVLGNSSSSTASITLPKIQIADDWLSFLYKRPSIKRGQSSKLQTQHYQQQGLGTRTPGLSSWTGRSLGRIFLLRQ